MMDCSSKLALRTGDQLKSVAKAEQDRQQRAHLQPVQQQANRFKAHLSTPWCLVARKSAALSVGHGRQRARSAPARMNELVIVNKFLHILACAPRSFPKLSSIVVSFTDDFPMRQSKLPGADFNQMPVNTLPRPASRRRLSRSFFWLRHRGMLSDPRHPPLSESR